MLTALKVIAGIAALMLVLLGLIAAVGGVVGFVRRALRGPGHRPTGMPQPNENGRAKGRE